VPPRTPGQFRKLDAVAVLTGPLLPAPRVHPHARRRGQVLVLSSRVHQIGAAADLDELDAQLGELRAAGWPTPMAMKTRNWTASCSLGSSSPGTDQKTEAPRTGLRPADRRVRRRGEFVDMSGRDVMPAWDIESGNIDVAVPEDVAVVTFRRPQKLNALTGDMRRELAAILRHFGTGDSVRGIVLTGTGRAFSAGEDLTAAAELPEGGLVSEDELFHDITRAALETRVPLVAALNGIAVGGACEMTLCFDARIGTPAAEYFFPENNLGLTISNAASALLPQLVGHKAMRLVMESARINAQDALSFGLLDEIVEETDLVETAIRMIHRWTRPGAATAAHLQLLRPPLAAIEQAIAVETEAARSVDQTGIAHAGINQFLSQRSNPRTGS
jgi:enoyl-CoA hydratase/carnithine racemase